MRRLFVKFDQENIFAIFEYESSTNYEISRRNFFQKKFSKQFSAKFQSERNFLKLEDIGQNCQFEDTAVNDPNFPFLWVPVMLDRVEVDLLRPNVKFPVIKKFKINCKKSIYTCILRWKSFKHEKIWRRDTELSL